jgi:hypothetical protein
MRAIIVGLMLLGACNEGTSRTVRWPEHRHHHDEELEQLEKTSVTQQQLIDALQRRIAKLEAALATPAAPQPPSQTPPQAP